MKANRDQKIALLTAVIMGRLTKDVLKPKSVLNLNQGRLNGTPRFTLNNVALTMAQAFESIYGNDIEYQITKN